MQILMSREWLKCHENVTELFGTFMGHMGQVHDLRDYSAIAETRHKQDKQDMSQQT